MDDDYVCLWRHSRKKRSDFLRELDGMRGKWSGAWCEGGDWNLIRFPMEKFGLCWVLVGIPFFFF